MWYYSIVANMPHIKLSIAGQPCSMLLLISILHYIAFNYLLEIFFNQRNNLNGTIYITILVIQILLVLYVAYIEPFLTTKRVNYNILQNY